VEFSIRTKTPNRTQLRGISTLVYLRFGHPEKIEELARYLIFTLSLFTHGGMNEMEGKV
jgi:hypothetical protein